MAAIPAIVELLQDILNGAGLFKSRRMFGGHGLYLDGIFFAILDDGVLFFKVSDATRFAYEAEGMGPFTYQTKTGEHALNSYWRLPERLLDEPDELRQWVRSAASAARATTAQKARKENRPAPARKDARTASKPGGKTSASAPKALSPGRSRTKSR